MAGSPRQGNTTTRSCCRISSCLDEVSLFFRIVRELISLTVRSGFKFLHEFCSPCISEYYFLLLHLDINLFLTSLFNRSNLYNCNIDTYHLGQFHILKVQYFLLVHLLYSILHIANTTKNHFLIGIITSHDGNLFT